MIRKRIRHTCGKKRKTISNWAGKLKDVPCFLVGCGPSLSDQQVRMIDGLFSIGINSAYQKVDPTILMWQDIEFWYQVKRDLRSIQALKYCRDTSDPSGTYYHFKLSSGPFKHTSNPMSLFGRGNTGALAFELACVLGCSPIVLLGYDCQYKGRKTDFFGTNAFHKPHTLRMCSNGLKWIHSNHTKERVEIINCSENKFFKEKYTLSEAVDMVEDKYKYTGRDLFLARLFEDIKK